MVAILSSNTLLDELLFGMMIQGVCFSLALMLQPWVLLPVTNAAAVANTAVVAIAAVLADAVLRQKVLLWLFPLLWLSLQMMLCCCRGCCCCRGLLGGCKEDGR